MENIHKLHTANIHEMIAMVWILLHRRFLIFITGSFLALFLNKRRTPHKIGYVSENAYAKLDMKFGGSSE